LPSPLLAGSPVRARSFYRAGRARSVIGGDFFDAVLGPRGVVRALLGGGRGGVGRVARLRVSGRARVRAGVDEPQLLPKLQQVLVSERHERGLFTTACTVALRPGEAGEDGDDPSRMHALVRLAGHPPPLVLGAAPRTVAPRV